MYQKILLRPRLTPQRTSLCYPLKERHFNSWKDKKGFLIMPPTSFLGFSIQWNNYEQLFKQWNNYSPIRNWEKVWLTEVSQELRSTQPRTTDRKDTSSHTIHNFIFEQDINNLLKQIKIKASNTIQLIQYFVRSENC